MVQIIDSRGFCEVVLIEQSAFAFNSRWETHKAKGLKNTDTSCHTPNHQPTFSNPGPLTENPLGNQMPTIYLENWIVVVPLCHSLFFSYLVINSDLKNIKWKIPEINNLYVELQAVLSGELKSHAIPLILLRDVNCTYPLQTHLHTPSPSQQWTWLQSSVSVLR